MRTKLESLKHILDRYLAGKLGARERGMGGTCRYRLGERNCAVGCLFNPAQLKDIAERNMNGAGIRRVAQHIGENNIEAVTGMKVEELATLQQLHDGCKRELVKAGAVGTPFHWYLQNQIRIASK